MCAAPMKPSPCRVPAPVPTWTSTRWECRAGGALRCAASGLRFPVRKPGAGARLRGCRHPLGGAGRRSLRELFGDKTQARALARAARCRWCRAPVGRPNGCGARFFASLPAGSAVMVKALAGGGGRGMRAVDRIEDLEQAFVRCRAEAKAAFGSRRVYLERLIRRARHIEVQVIGDGSGHVVHLGERECSLQRRNQKLIEIAPSPTLCRAARAVAGCRDAACRHCPVSRLGTFEFLVDDDDGPVRVHRGQPATAGGTHRHRDGHRHRPGGHAAAHCVGRHAGGAGPGAWQAAAAARLCGAAADQHGDHAGRWRGQAGRRHAGRFDPPSGPVFGSTPSATPATPPTQLRLAAGQADRAFGIGQLCAR